jgi:hypothetical protein
MSLAASSLIWKQLTPSISNRRIQGESFRYWFLYRKKKASCQWFSLATASVVHGTATSTSEHAGLGGDMRQFFFSIQVVTNHFFKACLLAKLSSNFGMLRPERIWSYGRMMLPMF